VRAGVKRPPSAGSIPDGPPVKRSKDVDRIEDHYNARPEVGKTLRQTSPIIGLKNFNNWVKSVLIHRFAHPALAKSPLSSGGRGRDTGPFKIRGGKVLDMGCGKGGDLMKWSRAPVREYVGVDIASVSVDQARSRWNELRGPRFDGEFAALDCYTHPLTAALPPARLARPFDVVSMQFCMHYAFETPAKARQMLENVTRWLRPGGVFVGTIPNADWLLAQLDALPPDAAPLEFGNSVYKIRFEQRQPKPVFGHRYWFFLQDAVDDVPEYVVRWESFTGMAEEYGLRLLYKQEFHQVFQEHENHPEYGPLMVRMNVVDGKGESQMDEDQWEAANVYLAFAFEKR
jgi:mRNA (guanine-N7-)-methyltransferase